MWYAYKGRRNLGNLSLSPRISESSFVDYRTIGIDSLGMRGNPQLEGEVEIRRATSIHFVGCPEVAKPITTDRQISCPAII